MYVCMLVCIAIVCCCLMRHHKLVTSPLLACKYCENYKNNKKDNTCAYIHMYVPI